MKIDVKLVVLVVKVFEDVLFSEEKDIVEKLVCSSSHNKIFLSLSVCHYNFFSF